MDKKYISAGVALLIVSAVTFVFLYAGAPVEPGSADVEQHAEASVDVARGPHGGRLLVDGDLSIEITIFERGVPPMFRVYCFEQGESLDAAEVSLEIELHRLGGRVDVFEFTKEDDYLRGNRVVEEPHSFDVTVIAERGGQTHLWTYPSYEGRVSFTPGAIESSGLVVETAGPATLERTLTVYGWIVPNADLQADVIPRYNGLVMAVHKWLGDTVTAGEVVALVQSNDSLQSYEVRSPIAGTIVHKDIRLGEFLPEGKIIYGVADSSTVWADLHVYRQDFSALRLNQPVTLRGGEELPEVTAAISYLSPFGAAATQTLLARIELPNPTGAWRPGWFVTGEILVERVEVPLAVKAGALQTFRDWDVVFVNEGSFFEVRPLEIGRRDSDWVEVLSGIAAGKKYVTENSFIIKADIGKSGASHDH
jgi:cobalt-zinc-cadmium efflux system membrane fusion protein